jgi:capsular polysaccharide biosynthesis protein
MKVGWKYNFSEIFYILKWIKHEYIYIINVIVTVGGTSFLAYFTMVSPYYYMNINVLVEKGDEDVCWIFFYSCEQNGESMIGWYHKGPL